MGGKGRGQLDSLPLRGGTTTTQSLASRTDQQTQIRYIRCSLFRALNLQQKNSSHKCICVHFDSLWLIHQSREPCIIKNCRSFKHFNLKILILNSDLNWNWSRNWVLKFQKLWFEKFDENYFLRFVSVPPLPQPPRKIEKYWNGFCGFAGGALDRCLVDSPMELRKGRCFRHKMRFMPIPITIVTLSAVLLFPWLQKKFTIHLIARRNSRVPHFKSPPGL